MSKLSLTLRWMRVMFFCILFFGSFTASLYFPHQNVWWRVAMIFLLALQAWSFVNSYRRRAVRRHEEQM